MTVLILAVCLGHAQAWKADRPYGFAIAFTFGWGCRHRVYDRLCQRWDYS